nr:serine/threonine-protein kinase tel1 [Quercus suber]
MYEILFKVAVSEKSLWLKATTKTTKSALENRLTACAQALRQAVEIGVPTLAAKTFRALVDHVINTMLLSSGEMCGPIALDYTKLFRALLNHQPHVEHLPKHEWEQAADFCAAVLKLGTDTIADDGMSSRTGFKSHIGTSHGVSFRSSRSTRSAVGNSASNDFLTKQVTEEMVSCMSFLTAAPNASITSKQALPILWALIDFLSTATLGGRCNQDAFAGINHVLAWARTEDVGLTQQATKSIIGLAKHFWAYKSPALKDELLIALLYLRPFILHRSVRDDGLDFRMDISDLLRVMRADYSTRQDRKQLRVDDLLLSRAVRNASTICVPTLALKPNCKRAEHPWALVHILGFLTSLLISPVAVTESRDKEEDEFTARPRKRQKVNDEFNELLAATANSTSTARSCALQTILFSMQNHRLPAIQLAEMIDVVSNVYGDDSGSLSAWSFLVLAACAAQYHSRDSSLLSRWTSVWQLGVRGMTNTATCRTACRLLDTMLQVRLVGQPAISDLIQAITFSIDVNGPSLLVDAAANFLGRVVNVSQQSNPGTASNTAESVLAWVLRNFVPSKFEDRVYATNHSLLDLDDIVHLIDICLDHRPHSCAGFRFHIWDRIGQAWLACDQQHELLTYLLLAPQKGQDFHADLDQDIRKGTSCTSAIQSRQICQRQILNFFTMDLRRTQERWDCLRQDRASSISLDMFESLCSGCIALVCISNCQVFEDQRQQAQLQNQVSELLDSICRYASEPECSHDKFDSLLLHLAKTFSGLRLPPKGEIHALSDCEKVISLAASAALPLQYGAQYRDDQDLDEDEMDIDIDMDSQDSHRGTIGGSSGRWRNETSVLYSRRTLRSSAILYARLVGYIHESWNVQSWTEQRLHPNSERHRNHVWSRSPELSYGAVVTTSLWSFSRSS